MEFQQFMLVLEGFGRKPGGNHKNNHNFFLNDFFYVFFDGFQGFWQGPSLQVVQNAAKSMVFLIFSRFHQAI